MSKSAPHLLFILCGPSGVGKTTLAHHLMNLHPDLAFSVSYTTRPPRHTEEDGVDYNFVSHEEFNQMQRAGEFAEWAEVHGNRYGTTVATIEDAWGRGDNVIFDIDYQGAQQLRERFGDKAVTVLVLAPSMQQLEARLRGRGTDTEEVIAGRLESARLEIVELEKFSDYRLVNADREQALDEIAEIYAQSIAI